MIICRKCLTDNRDENNFCTKCGSPLDREIYAQIEERKAQRTAKKQKQINRYDQGVKEWFTSKTFKTLLTIGLVGGCCFASCSYLFYGSLIGLFGSLVTPPKEVRIAIQTEQASNYLEEKPSPEAKPYIVRETDTGHPIDQNTKNILNAWLETSAPANTPYWFITHWTHTEDGRMLVSLAGVKLSHPDEKWTLVNDTQTELPSKVLWVGTVEVVGNHIEIYAP